MTPVESVDAAALRRAIPEVVGILVRRGADFASAEDAVQTALLRAVERPPAEDLRDIRAWLVTVAWRAFLDQVRSDTARAGREERLALEPEPGSVPQHDDTLGLYFLCTHPVLTATSATALTLRAVAGLTTRQIADAFLVPEATMAQRISRAKQRLVGIPLNQPGDLSRVRADCSTATPSVIAATSHSVRSCSASGTRRPPITRAGRLA